MKFTVVIPTRERVDTLKWSLNTCLCQDYNDFEIIVSDNFSQDGTADFVASISDPRVRYINTGKRLGMSQNWEFALGHVKDSYVFFMGDDDGLLPNAIQKANQILNENRVDALAWKKAFYMWPNLNEANSQTHLVVPLRRGKEIRNSDQMLQRICNLDPSLGGLSYEHLPGLYNSFVTLSAINKARSLAGRFFCSQIPDVYSAIALTSSVKEYIFSYRPLSINGASKHSNGTSYMIDTKGASAQKFMSEDNIPFHTDILLAPSIPVIIAESIWQVRDNVPGCENYDINIEKLFAEASRLSLTLPKAGKGLVDAALERVYTVRCSSHKYESNDSSDVILQNIEDMWRRIIPRFENIFSYSNLTKKDVSNVYEASNYFQELDKQCIVLLFIKSFVSKLKHHFFQG